MESSVWKMLSHCESKFKIVSFAKCKIYLFRKHHCLDYQLKWIRHKRCKKVLSNSNYRGSGPGSIKELHFPTTADKFNEINLKVQLK